ncbi:ATP-grasp domain-containing protein [Lentibacillus sediminis]|uniref:ATP-grasp domain-containing protein n=1 Tax=Lentibacillus sediminis TaxID=1940529 RepID=UPI000C1BE80B|nr:ATP-grasp domain-containing protein [Lentibacillus sediminis]
MRNLNVLITGIGGPTAQGILRGLKDKENVHTIGTDRRCVTAGNLFCDAFRQTPPYTQVDAYKQAIKEIVKEEKIDAVFPTLHGEIEVYEDLRNELDLAVALPVSDQFEVMMDKEKGYQFLAENDLHQYIPKYYGFSNAAELKQIAESAFSEGPYICVKQVTGNGSMGFAVLTDRDNYLQAIEKGQNRIYNIADYLDVPSNERRIVMEYLDGKEHSVDVFIHEGEVITAVPRERTHVSNNIVLDGKVVFHKDLIEAATVITKAMATSGFINLQFITTDDGYKLTDVNARFGGSHVMSLGAGVNFPYLFLQYNVLGETETVNPVWNTRMVRYRDHYFIRE